METKVGFGKYRNGQKARIICVDRENTQYLILSLDKNGMMVHHLKNGRVNLGDGPDSQWDLIE